MAKHCLEHIGLGAGLRFEDLEQTIGAIQDVIELAPCVPPELLHHPPGHMIVALTGDFVEVVDGERHLVDVRVTSGPTDPHVSTTVGFARMV